jgi:hypothetical protein
MSQNYLKGRLHRGVSNFKVSEGERVVFGGKLYVKHNGGLKKTSKEETLAFIKEHTQKKEQQQ